MIKDIERIYDEHFVQVYKYVLSLSRDRYIAEEITQETFFKALKGIDDFKGECRLSVWLCQIAKNTYFKHVEKSRRILISNDIVEEFISLQGAEDSVETKLQKKEYIKKLHQILHEMDEPYKEVFSLRTFVELTFLDIGELFDKSDSWARVTYHRAKLKIMEVMKNEDFL